MGDILPSIQDAIESCVERRLGARRLDSPSKLFAVPRKQAAYVRRSDGNGGT